MRSSIRNMRTLLRKVALREGRLIPSFEDPVWTDPDSEFIFPFISGPDVRDAAGNLVLGPPVPKTTMLYGKAGAGIASTGVPSAAKPPAAVPLARPPAKKPRPGYPPWIPSMEEVQRNAQIVAETTAAKGKAPPPKPAEGTPFVRQVSLESEGVITPQTPARSSPPASPKIQVAEAGTLEKFFVAQGKRLPRPAHIPPLSLRQQQERDERGRSKTRPSDTTTVRGRQYWRSQ